MKTLTNITVASFTALTLILTGCVKEERSGGDEQTATAKILGVNAFVSEDATTRAVVPGTSLTSGTFFGLYGYKGTTLYTDAETEGTGRPADNVKVDHSGEIQGDAIYWPTSNFSATADNIKFFAYYPYQLTFGTNITTLAPSSTGLTIGWKTPATADVDLMYASSATYTAVPTTDLTKGKASLTFNHILSYFKVQAKLVDNTADKSATIIVNKATLKHQTSGTYTGSTNAWSGLGTEDVLQKSQDTDLIKIGSTNESAFTDVAEFLVIPQAKAAREVELTYTLKGVTGKTVKVLDASDNIPEFQIGKINILTITFTVTDKAVAISFGIDVNQWTTEGAATGSVTENIEV